MTTPLLVFDRDARLLHLLTGNGSSTWAAANNADSTSRGRWPTGVFSAQRLISVGGEDGTFSGAYGPWFLRYDVPGRTGMGIHAGRDGDADGLGRSGIEHATMGCIRTSRECMDAIVRAAATDLPMLWVPV